MKRVPILKQQYGLFFKYYVPVYGTYNLWGYTLYLVKLRKNRYTFIESTTGTQCTIPFTVLEDAKNKGLGEISSHGKNRFRRAINRHLSEKGRVENRPPAFY